MDTSELEAAYRAVLDLAATPGTAGLIGALEASGRELLELAGRLDQARADTPLPARIVDGDTIRVDRPLPVAGLLAIQARAHLPMHRRQLSELLGRP